MSWRVKRVGTEDTKFVHKMKSGHEYPIFWDDELRKNEDGTYTKVAPGLCIGGIVIPDELVEEYDEQRRWGIGNLDDFLESLV
jgi:hypothetical protein